VVEARAVGGVQLGDDLLVVGERHRHLDARFALELRHHVGRRVVGPRDQAQFFAIRVTTAGAQRQQQSQQRQADR